MIIRKTRDIFATITTEGSALPPDILQRVANLDQELQGLEPVSYHLQKGEKISEATNRAWNRILSAWTNFKTARDTISADKPGTSETREKWLLPLFAELGYGRLLPTKAVDLEGKTYSISHGWGNTPIHLLGCNVPLDKRTRGIHGATAAAPHGLVQEFLNRSDDHLWAFVSNGLKLRILRDNISLTRQAYVEFDLEAMMEGQVYPDFRLLWLLCHQSRVEAEKPEECWLEKWSKAARDIGARVLDDLRNGVEQSINHLGAGFLSHPANTELREKLRSGELDKQDYFRQLLRLIYRLLFLFVSEDRGILLKDMGSPESGVYLKHYSTARLRRLAATLRGGRHDDLYEGLRLVMQKLGSDEGCPELGLSPLGSFLFSPDTLPDVEPCRITNIDLLSAIRNLATITGKEGLRPVDFKNLGSEELGSIYESLLELHPELEVDAGTFVLTTFAGHERKTTGSYYTPESLIQNLLDTALDPVLRDARKAENPEAAILDLKVCDPACGSGHFLIAAANRMAKALGAARTGEEEPSPEAVREAKRDVIGRCIYGADINQMAVELCKVSLWLESMDPGKPLSFLDSHIQVGNSLLGATPALLESGIPDDAFTPIEGDEKPICTKNKKENKKERKSREKSGKAMQNGRLPIGTEPYVRLGDLASSLHDLEALADDSIDGVREKERRYAELVSSSSYLYGRLWADSFCAAFVWKKNQDHPYPITEFEYRKIRNNPHSVAPWMRDEIRRLAEQYQFFHWHLAFPDVFKLPPKDRKPENEGTGWDGGFDVVLGNPPWEHTELKEQEWFASRRPDVAAAPGAKRKTLIAKLKEEDPGLWDEYQSDLRFADGVRHIIRNGGLYPFCGRGRINTYAIFSELNRSIMSVKGRVGCIVPSGICTDDTTKFFFQDIIETENLASLYDFENKNIFPSVHSSYKFCLLTLTGSHKAASRGAEFAFFLHDVSELREDWRKFTLTAEDIALINPNTRTCPIFRSKRDAEITKGIYRRVPVLIKEATETEPEVNPWGIKFKQGLFNMTSASHLFRTRQELEDAGWSLEGNRFVRGEETYLPLYEAKMIHHFDHRWATYEPDGSTRDVTLEEKRDPDFVVMPRYWVHEWEVAKRASNVPGELVKACVKEDKDELKKILRLWFAKLPDSLQDMKMSAMPLMGGGSGYSKEELQLIQSWQEECPITATDRELRATIRDDLELAHQLILKRTPEWFLGWRDICRSTDERTVIPGITPKAAFGDTFLLMFPSVKMRKKAVLLSASLTSFAQDYAARQKVGGTHLKYHVFKQIPALPPEAYEKSFGHDATFGDYILEMSLRLFCSSNDMSALSNNLEFASEISWVEDRHDIRCKLDAAFFHLYGLDRDDVEYIMGTFPIVEKKDRDAYGEYRTKELILHYYDQIAAQSEEPTEPLSTNDLPYRDYFDSDRAAWANVLIPHFVRLKPGLVLDDYVDMALLSTAQDQLVGVLPKADSGKVVDAMRRAGIPTSIPADQKIRKNIVVRQLQDNGLRIDMNTNMCTLPDEFPLESMPAVNELAEHALQALRIIQKLMQDATASQQPVVLWFNQERMAA
jgi:hypothetical protein